MGSCTKHTARMGCLTPHGPQTLHTHLDSTNTKGTGHFHRWMSGKSPHTAGTVCT